MKFLKVPNRIFGLGLSSTELKCYLYLTSCQNCLGAATVRLSTIQAHCSIASATTVRSALQSLESKHLVVKIHRHDRNGQYISSKFHIAGIEGNWFRVEVSADLFTLDKSAFNVYLYLCQQRMSSGKACPSQSVIAAAVGMARRTVNDAIARLVSAGMLAKAAIWKGCHNLYTILTGGNKKELPPCPPAEASGEQPIGSSKTIFTLTRLRHIVKRFFVDMTCAKNDHQYIDLTFTLKKKRVFIPATIYKGSSVPWAASLARTWAAIHFLFLRWSARIVMMLASDINGRAAVDCMAQSSLCSAFQSLTIVLGLMVM